jgi:hypothetical protein
MVRRVFLEQHLGTSWCHGIGRFIIVITKSHQAISIQFTFLKLEIHVHTKLGSPGSLLPWRFPNNSLYYYLFPSCVLHVPPPIPPSLIITIRHGKVMLSLCLTKHNAMKTYWEQHYANCTQRLYRLRTLRTGTNVEAVVCLEEWENPRNH